MLFVRISMPILFYSISIMAGFAPGSWNKATNPPSQHRPSNIDATLSIGAVFLHEAFHIFVEGLSISTHWRLPTAGRWCHRKGGGLGFLWKKCCEITNRNLSFKGRVPTTCLKISSESCSKMSPNVALGSFGLFQRGQSHLPLISSEPVIPKKN